MMAAKRWESFEIIDYKDTKTEECLRLAAYPASGFRSFSLEM
jgi:hypothetical protein